MRGISFRSGDCVVSVCGVSEKTYQWVRRGEELAQQLTAVMPEHLAPEHLQGIRHLLQCLDEGGYDPRRSV